MSLILILTHSRDGSAEMVISHLRSMGAEFVRFNTDEFPQKAQIVVNPIDIGDSYLQLPERKISFGEISVIWNRRPHLPVIDPAIKDEVVRHWAEEESQWALQCFYTFLTDAFWINPVLRQDRIQFNKLLQIVAAKELGFAVPRTILTNSPAEALAVRKKWGIDLAIKVIKSGVLQYQEKTLVLHTVRLNCQTLENNIESIAYTPTLVQEYVEKKKELRVNVVGEKVFACEIDSQISPLTRDDWRKHVFLKEELPHAPILLPREIEDRCVALVKKLGLVFGALDFILTPENGYVFLEINPNGQWGWVEQLTGLPIAKAIAELLSQQYYSDASKYIIPVH